MAGTSHTSYIVYPSQGSPKSFGYLKSAKAWAQTKANESGVTSIIYLQGGKRSKTWHVRPKKSANPGGVPRGKWVKGQVMVTSSGQVKFKRSSR